MKGADAGNHYDDDSNASSGGRCSFLSGVYAAVKKKPVKKSCAHTSVHCVYEDQSICSGFDAIEISSLVSLAIKIRCISLLFPLFNDSETHVLSHVDGSCREAAAQ